MLYVKAKLPINNGGNLGAEAAVGPTNLVLHSLFSQVDILLNGTLVTFLDKHLSLQSNDGNVVELRGRREAISTNVCCFTRTKRAEWTLLVEATRNERFHHRCASAAHSREFDMMGRLHADIFFQVRYMINDVGVKTKLVRSNDAFCVMGAGKVQVLHASLFVRKVKLMSSVFVAHAKTLESGTAKYPIRRVVCKSFTIPQGYRDINHEKLFYGQLPTRIVVGYFSNRAFNGHSADSPLNFQHFNLNEIA